MNYTRVVLGTTRVFVRPDGRTTSPMQDENPVGWFNNVHNEASGWTIAELEEWEREWLESKGVDTENVFRSFSYTGNTSFVKFRFDTGYVAFFDSEHLTETDEARFEGFFQFRRVVFDSEFSHLVEGE